jgi:hypothetical protein
MNTGGSFHTATRLIDGRILIAGSDATGKTASKFAFRFPTW